MQSCVKRVLIPMLLTFAAAGAAVAGDATPAFTINDKLFIDNAAVAAMTEVEAGRLAQQKGTTDAIRDYGKKLEDDHRQIEDPLEALAASKSIRLPTRLDAKHRTLISHLRQLSGDAFDDAFIKEMKLAHAEAVAQFDRAGASRDEDVMTFAKKVSPILKEHAQGIPSFRHSP